MAFLKRHWQLIVLITLVFALWNTPVMAPLKILVVLLHELAHAGMAVLTGGDIVSITVSAQEGGVALVRGGNRFLTLTAGYLGSLLIGVTLLIIALRTSWDRATMAICGSLILLVTVLYIRQGFAVAFSAGTGVAMLAIARFLGRNVNDLILRIIGLTSMIYVPYDIFSDTIARSGLRSDARMLAEEFGGATIIWGGLWLALSLVVIVLSLRYGLGPISNISIGKRETR